MEWPTWACPPRCAPPHVDQHGAGGAAAASSPPPAQSVERPACAPPSAPLHMAASLAPVTSHYILPSTIAHLLITHACTHMHE